MTQSRVTAHLMVALLPRRLDRLLRYVDKCGKLLELRLVGDDLPPPPPPARNIKFVRNQEILEAYRAGKPSTKLAEEYGITRERVCQILRPTLEIEKKAERRRMMRESLRDEIAAVRSQIKATQAAALAAGVELVRGGVSMRRAAAQANPHPVAGELHTRFEQLLCTECRRLRIAPRYGRHRDFSARKAQVMTAAAAGLGVKAIVAYMRANGDPHIHLAWIYQHCREIITPRPRRQA